MLDSILEKFPEIITKASESPLGIAALAIMVLGTIGFWFFKKEEKGIKLFVFGILLVGILGFSWAIISINNDSNDHNNFNNNEQHRHINTEINEIVIGGKYFLESSILLELMAILIEKEYPKLKVKRNFNVGSSFVVFPALMNREIHLYAEYSGSILANNLGYSNKEILNEDLHSIENINQKLKQIFPEKNIEWLDHFGFSNGYVLVMLRKKFESLNIEYPTISSLSKNKEVNGNLRISTSPDFNTLHDGLIGLTERYNLMFSNNPGIVIHENKYDELLKNNIDITDGYETDPQINNKEDNRFIKLIDNQNFFPKYYAGPLADKEILEKYPKIRNALSKLAGRITEEDMAQLIGDCQKELNKLRNKSLRASKQARGILYDHSKIFLTKKGILSS